MSVSPTVPDIVQPTFGCNCIELINDGFARDGRAAMVDAALIWSQDTDTTMVRIAIRCVKTSRSDRKRTPVLIADYCPICGNRYIAAAQAPEGVQS